MAPDDDREAHPEGVSLPLPEPKEGSNRALPVFALIALGIAAVIVVWVLRGGSAPWRLEVVDLPQAEESSNGASLSPDGTQVAWSSNRAEASFGLYVSKVDGTGERRLPKDGSFDEPRWTRDGKFLLSSSGNALQKVPIDGGEPILLGVTGNNPTTAARAWCSSAPDPMAIGCSTSRMTAPSAS